MPLTLSESKERDQNTDRTLFKNLLALLWKRKQGFNLFNLPLLSKCLALWIGILFKMSFTKKKETFKCKNISTFEIKIQKIFTH